MAGVIDRRRIEVHLKELFEEEVWEAGTRLARALAAEEEGLPEVAAALRVVAEDEARHAYLIAQLACPEQIPDGRESLARAIGADSDAAEREAGYARLAAAAGLEAAAQLFERLQRDERRHVELLEAARCQPTPPTGPGAG